MSCLPASWSSNKRRSSQYTEPNKKARVDNGDLFYKIIDTISDSISHAELSAPNDVQCTYTWPDNLLHDTLPFMSMLQQMPDKHEKQLPLITRAYEERYMRSCVSNTEKPCIMGANCECMFIDSSLPFVGIQFPMPAASFVPNSTLCLLCLRKSTQILFYHVVQNNVQTTKCIQKYGNICNEKNEYHVSAMLICPPSGPVHNMPLPVVAHQRNRYSVEKTNGVYYIRQHGVYYEDF